MSGIHSDKAIQGAKMDATLAARVRDLLRSEGYSVQWHDIRDVHGARLHPAQLRVRGRWVLVRRPSAHLTLHDKAWARRWDAFVQLGANDLADLRVFLGCPQ